MEVQSEPVYQDAIQISVPREFKQLRGFYLVDNDKLEKIVKILKNTKDPSEFYERIGHMIGISAMRKIDSSDYILSFHGSNPTGSFYLNFGHYRVSKK